MINTVVIIGAGFTVTILAVKLIRLKKADNIIIFEKTSEYLFRGPAYIKHNKVFIV
jgi:uncharacterized NAD(P)/FAD-binding protein YdhS